MMPIAEVAGSAAARVRIIVDLRGVRRAGPPGRAPPDTEAIDIRFRFSGYGFVHDLARRATVPLGRKSA